MLFLGPKGSLKREVRGILVGAGLEICRRCLGLSVERDAVIEGVQGRDALFGSRHHYPPIWFLVLSTGFFPNWFIIYSGSRGSPSIFCPWAGSGRAD